MIIDRPGKLRLTFEPDDKSSQQSEIVYEYSVRLNHIFNLLCDTM